MDLIDKYIGGREYEVTENKIDIWLIKNGWKETHGIALYTNKKYPGVGVDTNSGDAEVLVFKDVKRVFNDEGATVEYTNNIKRLEKAIKIGNIEYILYNKLTKKYKGSSHLTDHSISIFMKNAPSITVYFDQIDKNGLVVVLGSMMNKPNELNRFKIKFDNQVVKNALLQIELNHEALRRIEDKKNRR